MHGNLKVTHQSLSHEFLHLQDNSLVALQYPELHIMGTTVQSLRQYLLWAGSVTLRLFLLGWHNTHKFSSFWWSDLGKQTESSCLELWGGAELGYESSCSFSACRVQSWSLRPSVHPVWTETKGRGRGNIEGGVLPIEHKVKGCHGPANGDEELTLNLTLPVRGGGDL